MKFWTWPRFLAIAIAVIIGLILLVLSYAGVENLIQSLTELLFLFLGGLGALAIELFIWPERFLGRVEKTEPEVEARKPPETPMAPHSPKQLKYRAEVRAELISIRQELDKKERKAIQFESWNAFPKPDTRQSDINNPPQFVAIEGFSTILTKRNNNLNDSEFPDRNDDCIAQYVNIRKLGFLNVESAETDQALTEFDVKWHLSAHVLSVPPFGSQDKSGSDKASTLHVRKRGKNLSLTSEMKMLKPSYTYAVYFGKPFIPFSIGETGPNPVVGAGGAPYAVFTTDENGNGSWDRAVTVNELTPYGIVDRFRVLVNDGPLNKTVLISEDISTAL